MKTFLQKTPQLIVLLIVLLQAACLIDDERPSAVEMMDLAALPVELSVETAHLIQNTDETLFVDVREADDAFDIHIPDSVYIPLSELGVRVDELPAGKTLIFIAPNDGLSRQATEQLTAQQIEGVHSMIGGIEAWRAASHLTVSTNCLNEAWSPAWQNRLIDNHLSDC